MYLQIINHDSTYEAVLIGVLFLDTLIVTVRFLEGSWCWSCHGTVRGVGYKQRRGTRTQFYNSIADDMAAFSLCHGSCIQTYCTVDDAHIRAECDYADLFLFVDSTYEGFGGREKQAHRIESTSGPLRR